MSDEMKNAWKKDYLDCLQFYTRKIKTKSSGESKLQLNETKTFHYEISIDDKNEWHQLLDVGSGNHPNDGGYFRNKIGFWQSIKNFFFLERDETTAETSLDKICSLLLKFARPDLLHDIKKTINSQDIQEPASLSPRLYEVFLAVQQNCEDDLQEMRERMIKVLCNDANPEISLLSTSDEKTRNGLKEIIKKYLEDKTWEGGTDAFLNAINDQGNQINRDVIIYYANHIQKLLKARKKDQDSDLKKLKKAINAFARAHNKQPLLTKYDPNNPHSKRNRYHSIQENELDSYNHYLGSKQTQRKQKIEDEASTIWKHKLLYPLLRSLTSVLSIWSAVTLFTGWGIIPTLGFPGAVFLVIILSVFVPNFYSNYSLARDDTREYIRSKGFQKLVFKNDKSNLLQKSLIVITTLGVVSIYAFPFCYAMISTGSKVYGSPLVWGLLGGAGGIFIGYQAFRIFSHKIAKFFNQFWQKGKTSEENPDSISNFFKRELVEPWIANQKGTAIKNATFMLIAGGVVVAGNYYTWPSLTNSIRDIAGKLNVHLTQFGADFYSGVVFIVAATLIFFNALGSGIFSAPKMYNTMSEQGLKSNKRIQALNEAAQLNSTKNVKLYVNNKKVNRDATGDKILRGLAAFGSNAATVVLQDMGRSQSLNFSSVVNRIAGTLTAGILSLLNKIGTSTSQAGIHNNNEAIIPIQNTYQTATEKLKGTSPRISSPNRNKQREKPEGSTSKSDSSSCDSSHVGQKYYSPPSSPPAGSDSPLHEGTNPDSTLNGCDSSAMLPS